MEHRVRDAEVLEQFGKRLRDVRLNQGMTQEDLAHKADIAFSSVARIETGKLNTTISTIAALARALNVDKQELLIF